MIKGFLLGATLLFAAPQAAHAQAADTVSIAVTTDTDRSSADGIQVNEGDTITITATLHNPTGSVAVDTGCLDFDGMATAGTDFIRTRTSGGVTCPTSQFGLSLSSGNPMNSEAYRIENDTAAEGDETITLVLGTIFDFLQLGDVQHATVTAGTMNSITVTILANDGATTAFIGSAGAASVSEGATINVPVELRSAPPGTTRTAASTVAFSIATGGGAASADYMVATGSGVSFDATVATGTITIAAADSSGSIPIMVRTDSDDESGETLTVTLTGHTGASGFFFDSAARTYMLRDSVRDFAIAVDEGMRMEGETAVFTVSLTGTAPTAAATVDWAVSDTTGITTDDYTVTGAGSGSGGTLTFTAIGEQELRVAILPDLAAEAAEMLTITLTNAGGGGTGGTGLNTDTASTTIAASTVERRLTLSGPATVSEGSSATYTIALDGTVFASDTTVTWTITSDNTDLTAADFTGGLSGSVTFPMNAMMTTFSIGIVDDDADNAGEGAESFSVAISTTAGVGVNAISGSPVMTTIAAPVVAGDAALQELVLPEVARAVVGQQMSALVERVGAAGSAFGNLPSFNLNGASTLAGVAAANAKTFADGDGGLDAKKLLRDFDFVMPLSAGASGGSSGVGSIAFWGSADYRDFSGEDGDSDWDGGVTSLHFGVDGKVRGDLLAGVMVSYADSSSEYTQVAGGNTVKGDYELDLTSVSPYLNWQLGDGASAWASVSYGSGEVEVKPDGADATTNDVSMQSFAFGGSKRLLQQGKRELSLKADLFVAEAEVEGNAAGVVGGLAEDLTVDANRVRVALAWREPHSGKAKWKPAFDLGLRHDGGDGRTGAGVELGGALRFYDSAVGLTIEGRARALVGHTGDHRGWGVGGLMRVESGADGQGLSLSLVPSYGNADVDLYGDSGVDSLGLWDNDLASAANSAADLTARLNAEVGYGLPSKLTPYSAMRVGDSNRDYRLGMRWSAGSRIGLDLSARRLDTANAATDNIIALEGRLRF